MHVLLPIVLALSFAYVKGDCQGRLAACEAKRPPPRRPVCGTDNQTYPTRCHLLRAQCQQQVVTVTVKHRGKCREKQPCWADQALKQGSQKPKHGQDKLFVPTCLADGRYAPVQCHDSTGYCWCVTPAGRPLPNTSLRHSKPRCKRRRKTRRGSIPKGNKQKKECGRIDRATFVSNLVKIFRSEHNRSPAMSGNFTASLDKAGQEQDRRAVEWKFSRLDIDKSDSLSLPEYRELRRLVRKAVKPRRCARAFARMCDLDQDLRISRLEWASCLTLDFNPESSEGEEEEEDEPLEPEGDPDITALQESMVTLTGHISGFDAEDGLERRDEPEANDCLSDRKAVLEEQKIGSEEMYVPECTADGRYQKIQCYKSTGYCWCVHEDSGKPIPGTSVKDLNPKCDSVQVPSRPMKGCPDHKKQAFLKDLMDFLMHTMAAQKSSVENGSAAASAMEQSGEEQIATWNFLALDTNKNKVLERKEWKSFRVLISSHHKLRRCGKKLPRYCDVNHDRKISMTEWLNCLNAQRAQSDSSMVASTSPRRRGPNPLESLLMGDD